MIVVLEDILIAARTLYGEARGCSRAERRKIVHVMRNRRDRRIGDADHSLAATCLRWRQFSAWNDDDPNRPKLLAADFDDPVFRECVADVCEALNMADTSNGATHYMTRARRAQGWPSSWGPEVPPVAEDEKHLFYRIP